MNRLPALKKIPAVTMLLLFSLSTPSTGQMIQVYGGQLKKSFGACLSGGNYANFNVGIYVGTVDSGQAIYELQSDKPFIPASVVKAITSGICLDRFGPDFVFQTHILTDGEVRENVLTGNLYLRGRGDPGLTGNHLEKAAEAIKASGIRKIIGDLIYDNSFLDEEAPRFPPNARHLYAPPDALTVNSNWIILGLDPGPPVSLKTIPDTGYARLDYQVSLSDSDAPGNPLMTYKRMPWGDQYHIEGRITRWDRRYKILRLCVTRPALYTATLFKESLEENGILLAGNIRKGLIGSDARLLETIGTDRMRDIIRELNLESNNVVAELINKNLGAYFGSVPGTREKGLNLMRRYCREVIGIRGFSLQDSSGLSVENRMTPRQVCQALNHFYQKMGMTYAKTLAPQGHHPHALSPVPPAGMAMYVKSGTLPATGVNTIAGYIIINKIDLICSFAIMVNRKGPGRPAYSGTHTIPLMTELVRVFGSEG